ncbi:MULTISPECIES: SLBB domain-containing protein [Planktothricoides]|uniref:SLBB domain-containing protein n=1 Tax=Planktothricoides raciborskii FACHB-1370 TaxID=2949576 RepID=A0ABR8EAJ4_9CYAN|nr:MULTISPECIES: SLBB domain-containing protein [Planktothricoides]MBD2543194.1 SLBB domain-containing protein [Planktothricoides raciborskii FACHB-1370]MBD2580890.1 SLBB domain-containing protein [Planktothricoides raciborskii FACHB-1261]
MMPAYSKNQKLFIPGQGNSPLISSLNLPIARIALSAWIALIVSLPAMLYPQRGAIAQQMPSPKPTEPNAAQTNPAPTNPAPTNPAPTNPAPPNPTQTNPPRTVSSPPPPQGFPPAARVSPPPVETAYTLGPGDAIQVDIFNVPEYSGSNGQYEVLVDGTINMALIGTVRVEGLTISQLTGLLQQAYRPYLQRPELLTVKLLAKRPLQIGIAGEVRRPGSYTMGGTESGPATIAQVIQLAGGITQSADIRQIQLRRRQLGRPDQLTTLDLAGLIQLGDLSQDISLRDGDTIFIPTATTFNPFEASQLASATLSGEATAPINIVVVGEVSRPGSYTVTRVDGTGGTLTISRALQTAGGVSLSADIGSIQLIRRPRAGAPQSISVNLWEMVERGDLLQDLILQEGDTIVVPTAAPETMTEARLVKLATSNFAADTSQPLKIAIVGEVTRPGTYTVGAGGGGGADPNTGMAGGLVGLTRLTLALQTAGGVTLSADIGNIQVIRRPKAGTEQTISVNLWDMVERGNLTQDIILQQGDTIVVPTVSAENFDPARSIQLATANFAADTSQPLNIAVVGEVNRPGTYTVGAGGGGGAPGAGGGIIGLTTVTRAIQTAGGITPLADIRQIEVRRQRKDGTQQLIALDLWQLLETGALTNDVILQQGDTIVVPTATSIDLAEAPQVALASFSPAAIRVNIVGEVLSPGTLELPPNTSLNQALLAAGGFNNSRARKDDVELIRLNPNGTVSKEVVPVDFSQGLDEQTNPTLRNGDVIVVGRSGLAKTRDTLGEIGGTIGAVTNPVLSVFGFLNFFQMFGGSSSN